MELPAWLKYLKPWLERRYPNERREMGGGEREAQTPGAIQLAWTREGKNEGPGRQEGSVQCVSTGSGCQMDQDRAWGFKGQFCCAVVQGGAGAGSSVCAGEEETSLFHEKEKGELSKF